MNSMLDNEKQLVLDTLNNIKNKLEELNNHHQLLMEKLSEVALIDNDIIYNSQFQTIKDNNTIMLNDVINDTINKIMNV